MHITFMSLGLEFTADARYYKGFKGSLEEPPEPGELELSSLHHTLTGTDVSFLLDSNVCDQLYEDAYDAVHDAIHEECACAAEAKADQRKEERMCPYY